MKCAVPRRLAKQEPAAQPKGRRCLTSQAPRPGKPSRDQPPLLFSSAPAPSASNPTAAQGPAPKLLCIFQPQKANNGDWHIKATVTTEPTQRVLPVPKWLTVDNSPQSDQPTPLTSQLDRRGVMSFDALAMATDVASFRARNEVGFSEGFCQAQPTQTRTHFLSAPARDYRPIEQSTRCDQTGHPASSFPAGVRGLLYSDRICSLRSPCGGIVPPTSEPYPHLRGTRHHC